MNLIGVIPKIAEIHPGRSSSYFLEPSGLSQKLSNHGKKTRNERLLTKAKIDVHIKEVGEIICTFSPNDSSNDSNS